jgi:hypothetical protein
MRTEQFLCSRCAHPHALDYRRSRAGPPPYIHGAIAERAMQCTRCGDEIPAGQGYVVIEGVGSHDAEKTDWRELLFEIGTTVLGVVLAAAPLALWLAPTLHSFLLVLIATIAAVTGLCLLDYVRGEGHLLKRLRSLPPVLGVSDRFITDVVKLLPMTHHNRKPGNPEFQRKMDRLKVHLDC